MKNSHRVVSNFCVNFFLVVFTLSCLVYSAAPNYPPTIKIPVTFYDFHSDSSNPEFEISPSGAAIKLNMVGETLDADNKPVLGSAPYFNRRIDRWFREWEPGDFSIYNYATQYPAGRETRYAAYPAGTITLPYDTSFKNIVIYDTLVFDLINDQTGTYEFTDNSFFPLDGKGFGNEGRAHNYSFAMELHSDFSKIPGLRFQFRGDDDVWAFVGGHLAMDLGGIHSAQDGQINLDEIPNLEEDTKYSFDFFYVERHVTQSSITITTNILTPKVDFDLQVYPNDTICPFTRVELVAEVKDDVYGQRPDLAKNVQWRVTEFNGQPENVLQKSSGDTVVFVPEVAYSHVRIEGSLFDGTDTIKRYLDLYIEPCAAYKIYIESKPVNLSDTNALRYPQELQSVEIVADQKTGEAYAVARDISGAYVRMADSLLTQWNITPDGASFAVVLGENNKKYHGIITRTGLEGNTYAVATEPNLLPDSVVVKIVPYYFVRLQLRDKLNNIIDTIRIETDSTGEYFVWGLKSTCIDNPDGPDCWVPTNAKWELQSSTIQLETPLPDNAQTTVIAPKYPGTGDLHLYKPDDSRTEPLDVPMVIVASPPSRVTISLLTPKPRMAGDTLSFLVQIFNSDTLVPGTFCFGSNGNNPNESVYSDRLGVGGGGRPYPRLMVDGVDTVLNVLNGDQFKVGECFENGIDTIKTVLYYAPYEPPNDSLHQISVILGNDQRLKASSELFALLPNALASIQIEDANHVVLPPQILTGDQSVTAYADGYDRFGNRKGFLVSQWSSTGTLNEITDSSTFVYVSATGVPTDQNGNICAAQYNELNQKISACLQITIIGPKKMVTSALTRDLDGNGLLDALEFTINRAVSQDEISYTNFTDVRQGQTRFIPESITFLDTNVFQIHFQEQNTGVPQTMWKLFYSISNATTIANTVLPDTSLDGAGPVIWKIEGSITKYTLKVYLSEGVKNVNNNTIDNFDDPSRMFNAYSKDVDGNYVHSTLLDSSHSFINVNILADDKTVEYDPERYVLTFYYDKNFVLTKNLYMNLKASDTALVQDLSKNRPHPDNIKRLIVLKDEKHEMTIGPNPTSPSPEHTNPGVLTLENDLKAIPYAVNGQGTIIQVTFTPDTSMSATLKIHDMVGNLVWWVHVPDYLKYLKESPQGLGQSEDLPMYTINIYWNCYNHDGMKVSPGIYRAIFTLNYKNSAFNDLKMIDVIGVKK